LDGGSSVTADAGAPDVAASVDATSVDKAANCASTFGTALTNAFGRVDGTVVAVVPPGHPTCAQPNRTHVVVQVRVKGAVYRMVVNILSTQGPPDVFFGTKQAPLPVPAWSEDWHPGATLDYPSMLGVTKADLRATPESELRKRVMDLVPIDAPISIYAVSTGGTKSDSAHKVHRNGNRNDGAIVLNPNSASPIFMMFAFDEQQF
jgi:hypothetical protein